MRAAFVFLLFCGVAAADITEQKSNTEENLRGISVVSSSVAWASGTHGTFLRMTDCCANWEVGQVPGAEKLDFRDVEAFSADVAYLLAAGPGDQSRIYKTADGGKNWTLQFANKDPKGFFDCMAFWDRNRGIAIGDPVNGKFQLIKQISPQHYFSAVTFVQPKNVRLVTVGTGQYAAVKDLNSKKWDIFEPLIRGVRTDQQPAQLNAVAAARHDFRIWTVGMKGAIFLIDDICRSCTKK